MRASLARFAGVLLVGTMLWSGCSGGKYDKLPKAKPQEVEALTERYQALIAEAKTVQGGDALKLLHHFSHAALTRTQPAAFEAEAGKFIEAVKGGQLDDLAIRGGRSPGKVRLLLVASSAGKGALPLVQSADGWKFDDVEVAFGNFEKELNLEGNMPESPPSILASLSVLQDPQASDTDKVQAAIGLAEAKDKATAERFVGGEKKDWPKAALLYASWKSGGLCEPFAKAFPEDGEKQAALYEADTESYRTLLHGLLQCAASSNSLEPTLKVYRGCYKVEGGPRSEYVDPLVGNPQAENEFLKTGGLANQKPDYIVKACLKLGYKYEEDPVANIVVNGLHGEKETGFFKYVHKTASSGGRIGKLAREWVEKMGKRDEMEPESAVTPEQ